MAAIKKKVLKHLRDDIKTFKHEADEDKELIKDIKGNKMAKHKKGKAKFKKVMEEFKEGELHSGSKKGPKVTKESQAKAIAFSEDRKADGTAKKPMKKKKK